MRLLSLAVCLCFVSPFLYAADPRPDIIAADFEGDTYGDWKVEGTAFGERPAKGALTGQMAVNGFLGKQLVNSFVGGDDSVGKLTSPPLKIDRKYINFLIGGGKHPGEACINLLVDGKVVRTSTGPNDRDGGSEQLEWSSWDVTDLAGKIATIEIVDARKGDWGHINIDQITQSDTKRGMVTLTRELAIDKRYLHLPVKNGAAKRRLRVSDGDKLLHDFEIELATDKPDFWTFLNVEPQRGKKLTLAVDRMPSDSTALDQVTGSDEVPNTNDLYREASRPQFHFTSRRGWLNDPNGLVYHDGEWHLFYQHNPYGWNWGNMHWGHAVSSDLFHWKELPIALYPRKWDDFAFSGSAVVDAKNTAGWKSGKEDVLVAAYTSTGRGECIVYSNDRGRTWQEYEKNPVVKHQGRDPKLLWHEPTKRWVMAVYNESQGKQWIAFHTSPDLKAWEFASRIEGYFECPDLFELPVIGLKGEKTKPRWVLYAADGWYALGDFDGREFRPDGPKQQLWHGNFYAAQTYSDAPAGRRVQVGWGRDIVFLKMPFNQQMVVPVELSLRKRGDVTRMIAQPVVELEKLHGPGLKKEKLEVSLGNAKNHLPTLPSQEARVFVDLKLDKPTDKITLTVRGLPIVYDGAAKTIRCKNVTAKLPQASAEVALELLIDRGSLELFADGGAVALSVGHIFPRDDLAMHMESPGSGGTATIRVIELKSAWSK